ncbi:MAG: serine/threonine-protein kinase [Limisphaerales bacterium]
MGSAPRSHRAKPGTAGPPKCTPDSTLGLNMRGNGTTLGAVLAPTSGSPYRARRELARGGMGAVLDAQDCKFGRSVAMKVMLRGGNASEEEKQRFLQEARVLGQLAHPNIVPAHDLGADEHGRLFYTMKLVRGVTLADVLNRLRDGEAATLARYPLSQLLTIFLKVCDGVAFAHSRGVIHRDLKPANIMVGDFGEVLVMDWGLAKILPESPAALLPAAEFPHGAGASPAAPTSVADETLLASPASPAGAAIVTSTLPSAGALPPSPLPEAVSDRLLPMPSSTHLTMEGTVLGTPNYLSPEQAAGAGAPIDARADVYSLGAIL